MEFGLLYRWPLFLTAGVKNKVKERKVVREARRALLMIENMPDWQKKDLNLTSQTVTNKYRL